MGSREEELLPGRCRHRQRLTVLWSSATPAKQSTFVEGAPPDEERLWSPSPDIVPYVSEGWIGFRHSGHVPSLHDLALLFGIEVFPLLRANVSRIHIIGIAAVPGLVI